MAYLQFPKQLLMKTFDTGERVELGGFQTTDNQELRHIRVNLFQNGTPGGLEELTLNLHTSNDFTGTYASSNTVLMSDVTDNLSWVRFDFARPNINKNLTYFATMTTANYTRNADVFYIALAYDFPFPIYTAGANTNFTDHLLASQVFGFK